MPINTGFADLMTKLHVVMVQALDSVTKSAKAHASWSSTIQRAIFVGKIKQNGFVITGEFGVDLTKAPEGRAFEYGSGLHATQGNVGPVLIRPKNAAALVFPGTHQWAGQTIIVPPMGGGVVKHPGVAERPYMRPAMQDVQQPIRALIDQAVTQVVSQHVQMAWSRIK